MDSHQEVLKKEKKLHTKAQDLLSQNKGIRLDELRPHEMTSLLNALSNSLSTCQLLIEEDDHTWLADITNWLPGIEEGTLETKYPPRIIPLSKILGIIPSPTILKVPLQKRREGEKPLIRKILISPQLTIQYANGEQHLLQEHPINIREFSPLF